MKLLGAYLRQRRRGLLACLLFFAFFAVSFALWHLPLEAVLYPAGLCLLVGLPLLGADLARVKRRHLLLERMETMTAAMIGELPAPEGIEEADCQAIIQALQREVTELEARTNSRFQDMLDYFTVWVHQIKTPIASMHLTLQNEDSPSSRKLSRELGRVEQYVEMVLAFLRLDAPSNDYVFRLCSVDAVIRQALAKSAGEFIDRHLTLDFRPTEQTVITDEKWLSFVVEQVLSNALKYTREGGISIFLEAPKTLCIRDTGMGIAPEDLPRVFEKGYTGQNGRVDRRASGLGLWLCRQICRNLGMEISITSRVGEGTCVRLNLEQRALRPE